MSLIGPWRKTADARCADRRRRRTDAGRRASPRAEIDAFLTQVRTLGPAVAAGQRGRLIFALDATMSRQPIWDTACRLQADMFREAAAIGGLDVQLVYLPRPGRMPRLALGVRRATARRR